MGNVWMVVLGTMLITTLCAFGWHFVSLRSVKEHDAREVAQVRANIAAYSAYRDVLKEKGKDAAKAYLEHN